MYKDPLKFFPEVNCRCGGPVIFPRSKEAPNSHDEERAWLGVAVKVSGQTSERLAATECALSFLPIHILKHQLARCWE